MQGHREQMERSSYLDFEVEIGNGSGRAYPTAVVDSPAGEARETMHWPYDEIALESRLKDLQIALLRSGGTRRRVPLQEEQAVQDFGRDLFDALFGGEVRSRYDVSLREAAQQGKGLRLKLRIQSPELAALPWEFLYDARQAEYVSLSRNTPIVRYLELPLPLQPLAVAPPLRILGMVAAPDDLPDLDIAREKERIERATRELQAQNRVELTWVEGQTWRDLQQAMWGGPWHVFHFIGHGGFDQSADEGFIALAEEDGRSSRLSATQLGRLLADHASLRLVLLNSCEGARGGERDIFSSTAAILVRRGVPAVVAMQYEITDQAAIEFAQAFYGALTHGKPVDEAVVEARKAISFAVANTVEWGTPVLHMRSLDGTLFDIERKALEPPRPAGHPPKARPVQPTLAPRWLRRLPTPAWVGLLVLLLLLAGVVGVWLASGGSTLSTAPTATAPVAIVQVTPTVRAPQTGPTETPSVGPPSPESGLYLIQTLAGPKPVLSVSFSPDGQQVAAGFENGPVHVWQVSDGTLLRRLADESKYARRVAYSEEGTLLATGSPEGTVALWRVSDGTFVRTLEGLPNVVYNVAFSPDGSLLAGTSIGIVNIWEVDSGALLHTLTGDFGNVLSVAFAPDGKTLATGGTDLKTRLWEVDGGTLLHTLDANDWVHSVAFSPDSQLLAAAGGTRVRLWSVTDGSLRYELMGHAQPVQSIEFLPDGGETLATVSWDLAVRVWQVSDGERLYTVEGSADNVRVMSLAPDGRTLASAAGETVQMWQVP